MRTQNLSRLELYVEILKTLETMQSASLLDIQEKASVERTFLTHALPFLEAQGLIKRVKVQNEIIYETTLRGERVTKYFDMRSQDPQPNEDTVTNFL
jgi:predicted transcriptional regulator